MTRVPANSIMPPGMAGKPDYFPDGEQFTFNPTKSKELLAEAGYEPGEYELTLRLLRARRPSPWPATTRSRRASRRAASRSPASRSRPPVAVRPLRRPGQQDQQGAQPPGRELVLGLALGPHHAAAAASRRARSTTSPVLLRAVDRRRDRPASRRCRSTSRPRLGRVGREDRDRVPPDHPDGVRVTTCTCSASGSATRPETVPSEHRTSRTSTSLTDRRRGTPATHETGTSLPSCGWSPSLVELVETIRRFPRVFPRWSSLSRPPPPLTAPPPRWSSLSRPRPPITAAGRSARAPGRCARRAPPDPAVTTAGAPPAASP